MASFDGTSSFIQPAAAGRPGGAEAVGGRKRERAQSAARRSRQEAARGLHILEWEEIDHLPSRVWSPGECEWTVHAMERAIERNITDDEFAEAFASANWEADDEEAMLRACYGRIRLIFAVDGPAPRVVTVVFTADHAA